MDFDPNIDEMTAHFALLYNWTQSAYPNALFEVRCIHPTNGSVKDARFAYAPDGYEQAVWFAVQHNDQGYNVYTTVNPLRPNTSRTATDEDVEIALYQCIDADGVDDPNALIAERSQGFEPTFTTVTGTVPQATLSNLLAAERTCQRHGGLALHTSGTRSNVWHR